MVCNRISNKLFAAKGEKQDMSTGENIKRIRKFRGMTQKELGIAIGIGEESASPRMAQYETDNRTPRKEMLNKMAVVLDVDPRNISIPMRGCIKKMHLFLPIIMQMSVWRN